MSDENISKILVPTEINLFQVIPDIYLLRNVSNVVFRNKPITIYIYQIFQLKNDILILKNLTGVFVTFIKDLGQVQVVYHTKFAYINLLYNNNNKQSYVTHISSFYLSRRQKTHIGRTHKFLMRKNVNHFFSIFTAWLT